MFWTDACKQGNLKEWENGKRQVFQNQGRTACFLIPEPSTASKAPVQAPKNHSACKCRNLCMCSVRHFIIIQIAWLFVFRGYSHIWLSISTLALCLWTFLISMLLRRLFQPLTVFCEIVSLDCLFKRQPPWRIRKDLGMSVFGFETFQQSSHWNQVALQKYII